MLDHMTFRVSDMTRTKAFYAATLGPLGYKLVHEGNHDGANLAGFGFADASLPQGMRIDTWFIDGPSPPMPVRCAR